MVAQIESYHLMNIYIPGNVLGIYIHYSCNLHMYIKNMAKNLHEITIIISICF